MESSFVAQESIVEQHKGKIQARSSFAPAVRFEAA